MGHAQLHQLVISLFCGHKARVGHMSALSPVCFFKENDNNDNDHCDPSRPLCQLRNAPPKSQKMPNHREEVTAKVTALVLYWIEIHIENNVTFRHFQSQLKCTCSKLHTDKS